MNKKRFSASSFISFFWIFLLISALLMPLFINEQKISALTLAEGETTTTETISATTTDTTTIDTATIDTTAATDAANTDTDATDTTEATDEAVGQESKGIDPKKALFEVDIKNQRVLVYYDGELLKSLICSTGNQNNSTPLGIYYTSQKIPDSYVARFDMRAHNWIRFYNTFLFHSVPFDKENNLLVDEVKKLGQPATHGCVRLGLADIKWLYDTFPLGVKVFIHE